MSGDIQKNERDLLIRVDADLKNLDRTVKEVRDKQNTQEQNAQKLTENVFALTANVGALVEGMRDAKDALHTIGKHEQRLSALETWRVELDEQAVIKEDEIYTLIRNDKLEWQPVAKLYGHWKWIVGTLGAFITVIGWSHISAMLKNIASVL